MSENVSSILVCIFFKNNVNFDLNYRYDCFVIMRTVQSKVRNNLHFYYGSENWELLNNP